MKTPKPLLLQRTATTLIDLYGSSRKAGLKVKVDHAQLFKMAKGDIKDAGTDTLAKLGLERVPGVEIHRRKQ